MHTAQAARRPLIALITLLALTSCKREIEIPVDPPEARKDYARTAVGTPVTLAPLANDFDPDGGALSIVSIGAPAHGTAVLNPDGTVLYTPSAGYTGGDSFTVTIRDAKGNEVTDSAYLTVGPSERFVYRSNFVDFFTFQLYLSDSAHPGVPIPVSGRIPVTEGPVRPFASVNNYMFSRNGRHLLYLLDEPDSPINNLYYVDLERPGVALKLTDMAPGEAVNAVTLPSIDNDGVFAYYLSNENNPSAFEVVRVEVANPSNKVRMNVPVTSHTTTVDGESTTVWGQIIRAELAPDDDHLIYVEFDPNSRGAGVSARELHVADVATPGVSTVISGTPTTDTLGVTEGFFVTGLGFDFVPGTDQLIYPGTENGSTFMDLYVVDYVAKSAPVKLSGTAIIGGVSSYRIAPDSSRIVYTSSEDSTTSVDLYTATFAAPGSSARLTPLIAAGRLLGNYLIGGDNSYVVYMRQQDTEGIWELYRVDFATPASSIKLNHALRVPALGATQEQVQRFAVSPGAPRTVLFSTNDSPRKLRGGFVVEQTFRTVSVDAPGVGTPIGQPVGIQFSALLWHAAGDYLVMFDDPEFQQVFSAFETRLSAPASFTKLTPEEFPGASVTVPALYHLLP